MRRRILTASLAVTAAALLIFGAPLGWSLGRVYRSQELTRLGQAATGAAAAVPAEGLRGPDPIEPPPVPAGIQLSYYDLSGALAAGKGAGRADAQARRAISGRPAEGSAGSRLVAAVPITANETTVGAVEASSPRSAVTSRSVRTWLAMGALGAFAMIIVGLIATWQARRLARPVHSLAAAASQLGDGDFTLRTPKSGIAELDRAAVALEATSARLGELVHRERSFTAHASHQLRTPLTALRLDLENSLETPGVDIRQAVGDAIAEVDRLQDTLDELLVLARTGGAPEQRVPLGDIMTPLEQRWHPLLAQRGRRLHVSADGSEQRPVPASVAQILDILLDNAATHGLGTVEVTATAMAGWISIDVQDEGGGLPAIAEPASPSAGEPARSHGLGLPLARSLAEASGGRLVLKRTGPRPIIGVFVPSRVEATVLDRTRL